MIEVEIHPYGSNRIITYRAETARWDNGALVMTRASEYIGNRIGVPTVWDELAYVAIPGTLVMITKFDKAPR